MPKIIWESPPRGVWEHLKQRAFEREITPADLIRLDAWKKSNPDAPEGEWVKDFGSFKLVGQGAYPKTFLLRGRKTGRPGTQEKPPAEICGKFI